MVEYKLLTTVKIGDATVENCVAMPLINNPDLFERYEYDWSLSQDIKIDLFYSADKVDHTDYMFFKYR